MLDRGFSRLDTQGFLLGLQPIQIIVGVAGLFTAAVGSLILRSAPGASTTIMVIGFSAVVLAALKKTDGTPQVEAVRVYGRFIVRQARGKTKMRLRPEAPRRDGLLRLPGSHSDLHLLSAEADSAVVVYDPWSKTATITALVEPLVDMRLQSDEEAVGLTDQFGKFLGGMARTSGIERIILQHRTLPASFHNSRRQFEQDRQHAHGLSPEALESYERVLTTAESYSATHQHLLSVVIKVQDRTVQQSIKKLGGRLVGLVATARMQMRNVEATFESLPNLRLTKWLTSREWAALGRSVFDPQVFPLIAQRAGSAVAGVNPMSSGPSVYHELSDRVNTGGAVHQTFWVYGWPREAVRPGFLSNVTLTRNPETTALIHEVVSLVANPQPAHIALRELERKIKRTAMNLQQNQRKNNGFVSEEDVADLEALRERQRAIVEGHADFTFSGYITVSAPNDEALDTASIAVVNSTMMAGMEIQLLHYQQGEALLNNVLPYGKGLS